MSTFLHGASARERRAATRRAGTLAVVALGWALGVAAVAAAPVLAHAELVSSDPADGAVLDTPPATIILTFSEGLDAGKSSFKVTGPAGDVGTGRAAKDGDEVMTLAGLDLRPGTYTIKWTSAAEDGHLDRGVIAFTVAQPAPATATASPAPTASTSSASPPSPAAAASSSPATVETSAPLTAASTSDVLLPIVVALALVGVVAALVLRRGRRA